PRHVVSRLGGPARAHRRGDDREQRAREHDDPGDRPRPAARSGDGVLFVRVRGARAARVARGGDAGGADRHAGRGGAGRRGDGAGGDGGGVAGGGAAENLTRSLPPPPSRLAHHHRRRPLEPQPLGVHHQVVVHEIVAVTAVVRLHILVALPVGVVHDLLDARGSAPRRPAASLIRHGFEATTYTWRASGRRASTAWAPRPTSTIRPCAAASAITRSVSCTIVASSCSTRGAAADARNISGEATASVRASRSSSPGARSSRCATSAAGSPARSATWSTNSLSITVQPSAPATNRATSDPPEAYCRVMVMTGAAMCLRASGSSAGPRC